MIATHDDKIIEIARKLNKKYKRKITYAMLNGIRNKYAVALAKSNERVMLYVPFGSDWVNYSMRRLKEQGHLSLIARSMFEKQDI
jgi:proline dehydrogenase